MTQTVFDQLEKMERQFTLLGLPLIILCSSKIRLPFRRLVERFKPNLVFVAINELTSDLEVDIRGSVTANEH
jgi:flagellar biosynthesis protein FlhA